MTEVLNTPRIDSNSYYMSTLWYNLSPIQGGLMTTLLLNRFFATLKKEELYRKDYTSETDFKRCLASYIEFYNTQRPHRTLKNRTPCQVEELFMNGK